MADNGTEIAETGQQEQERKSLYVGDLDPDSKSSVANYWGKSLCYGYVDRSSYLEAAKIMSMLNHTGNPHWIVWCERNLSTRKTGKANLFVKNLDPSIDSPCLDSIFSKLNLEGVSEAELKEKFSEYGNVNSAAIMRDVLGVGRDQKKAQQERILKDNQTTMKAAASGLSKLRSAHANANASANAKGNNSLFLLHSKPKFFAVMDNGKDPNNQPQESFSSVNNVAGNAVMVNLGAGGGQQQQGQNEHLPPPIHIPQNFLEPQQRPLVRIMSSILYQDGNQIHNSSAILGVIFAYDVHSWDELGAIIRTVYERFADPTDVVMNYPGFWPGRNLSYHCLVDNQLVERFPDIDDWFGQNVPNTLTSIILTIPAGRQCQIFIGQQLIGQLLMTEIQNWFHLATELNQIYLNRIGNAALNILPLNPCNCCPGAVVYYHTDLGELLFWTENSNLTQQNVGDNWSWVQQVLYKIRIISLLV